MLRVNGTEFTELPKDDPFMKIYDHAFKKLGDLKLAYNGNGRMVLSIQEAKRKESYDADGNKQHSQGCYINTLQRYQHMGVQYRLEYYESVTYQDDREKLLPISFNFDGTVMELTNDSKDKQFMIIFADPQCEKVFEIKEFQNEISRPEEFSIVMKERDTREKIQNNRERVELEKMLYDLENDHDRLLDVCYNFNIATERRQDYELLENLMNIVLMKDQRGNYIRENIDRFKSVVKPNTPAEGQLADMKAFLGRLIDSKLVICHGKGNGAWYLDEEKTQKLCSWRRDSFEGLFNYFLTHKEEIPIYEEKMKQLTPA